MRLSPAFHARNAGIVGFTIGAVLVALVVLGVWYTHLPKDAVGIPLPGDTQKVVPALGNEGYQATAEFCRDPLTKVRPLTIPDASGYELTRTKDGKAESITVVFGQDGEPRYAKYDADGIDPQPAVVTGDFRKCLQDKAR